MEKVTYHQKIENLKVTISSFLKSKNTPQILIIQSNILDLYIDLKYLFRRKQFEDLTYSDLELTKEKTSIFDSFYFFIDYAHVYFSSAHFVNCFGINFTKLIGYELKLAYNEDEDGYKIFDNKVILYTKDQNVKSNILMESDIFKDSLIINFNLDQTQHFERFNFRKLYSYAIERSCNSFTVLQHSQIEKYINKYFENNEVQNSKFFQLNQFIFEQNDFNEFVNTPFKMSDYNKIYHSSGMSKSDVNWKSRFLLEHSFFRKVNNFKMTKSEYDDWIFYLCNRRYDLDRYKFESIIKELGMQEMIFKPTKRY